MIDFQEFFLVILISTLTVLLVIFSIFVFRILQEFQETLRKLNKVLDDAGIISGSLARPVAGLADLVTAVKSGLRIFAAFGRLAGKRLHDDDDDAVDEVIDSQEADADD